jgi:hypothetical protein
MTSTLTPTPNGGVHVFETAGLGKAPYKFIGVTQVTYHATHDAPAQPGSMCMFCATGICYQFWLDSSDGKRFFVGSDCIEKSGDTGLMSRIEPFLKKHEKEMRLEREDRYISEFTKFVAADVDGYWNRAAFKALPHPNNYWASQGKTLGDYNLFCYTHAGKSSKSRMAHKILVAEGIMKKFERNAKRVTVEIVNGIIPEGAIVIMKTLFKVIPDSDDNTIFVIS